MKFFPLARLALGFGLLFVLCLPLRGQNQTVGVSGSIPINTLESMNDTFQVADRASQVDLLKRLGVDADIAEAATSPVLTNDIAIQPIHQHSRQSFGILTLSCGRQGQSFLYLLSRDERSQWHIVDSARLDCFATTPTFSLLSFAAGEDDVFVQHANSGHGTGMLEDSATLYTVRDGHLREILATPDHTVHGGLIDLPPLDQSSTFLQLPGQLIEETRVSSHDGLPVRAERRLWRWQTKQQSFRSTPFHEVREPEEQH
jgi:hypothetical protein